MTDSKDDKTPVDENGDATTELHDVMADAVHDAITDPFKETPRRGTAGEVIDGPIAQPGEGDDSDNPYDSGDDTGAFAPSVTNSDVADIYDTRKAVQPVVPGNVFQQYSTTRDARDAAERFAPKQYGTPDNLHPAQFGVRTSDIVPAHGATSDAVQDGDKLNIVGGNSATLDSNADRVLDAQIREATHAGGNGVAALQTQQAAARAGFLGVKSPMPVTVRLDPLARTPTPL